MESVLTFRGDMIENRLQQLKTEAVAISKLQNVQLASVSMRSGWTTVERANGGNAKDELQRVFVTDNPHPANERYKYTKTDGPSGFYYSNHEKSQLDIASAISNTPFTDVLFADPSGNIYYSYQKGSEFAENITTGLWIDGGLNAAFRKGVDYAKKAVDDIADTSFSGLKFHPKTRAADLYFAVPVVKFEAFKGLIIFKVDENALIDVLTKGLSETNSQEPTIITKDGTAIGVREGKLSRLDGTRLS